MLSCSGENIKTLFFKLYKILSRVQMAKRDTRQRDMCVMRLQLHDVNGHNSKPTALFVHRGVVRLDTAK